MSSYNEIFGRGTHSSRLLTEWGCQDDNATTTIVEAVGGYDQTLVSGTTSGLSTSGVGGHLPKGLASNGNPYATEGGTNIGFPNSTNARLLAAYVRHDLGTGGNRCVVGAVAAGGTARQFRLIVDTDTAAGVGCLNSFSKVDAADTPALGTWYHLAARVPTGAVSVGDIDIFINGILTSSTTDATALNTNSTDGFSLWARENGSDKFNGAVAEVISATGHWSDDEIAEIVAGPEPLNTGIPTLDISSSSWSGFAGNWDSQNNGDLSYSWNLRDGDTSGIVESGTGNLPNGVGVYSGSYYLEAQASNDGGFDSAQVTTGNLETVSGAPAANIEYRWKLDEKLNIIARQYQGTNDGTLVGFIVPDAWVVGKINGALEYTLGVDERIEIPFDILDGATDYSFAMWIRTDTTTGSQRLFSGAVTGTPNEIVLECNGSQALLFRHKNNALSWSGLTGLRDGTDRHLALTFDGSTNTAELFYDNVSQGTKVAGGSVDQPISLDRPIYIGNYAGGATTSRSWDGLIDDIYIYDGVYTSGQISGIFGTVSDVNNLMFFGGAL